MNDKIVFTEWVAKEEIRGWKRHYYYKALLEEICFMFKRIAGNEYECWKYTDRELVLEEHLNLLLDSSYIDESEKSKKEIIKDLQEIIINNTKLKDIHEESIELFVEGFGKYIEGRIKFGEPYKLICNDISKDEILLEIAQLLYAISRNDCIQNFFKIPYYTIERHIWGRYSGTNTEINNIKAHIKFLRKIIDKGSVVVNEIYEYLKSEGFENIIKYQAGEYKLALDQLIKSVELIDNELKNKEKDIIRFGRSISSDDLKEMIKCVNKYVRFYQKKDNIYNIENFYRELFEECRIDYKNAFDHVIDYGDEIIERLFKHTIHIPVVGDVSGVYLLMKYHNAGKIDKDDCECVYFYLDKFKLGTESENDRKINYDSGKYNDYKIKVRKILLLDCNKYEREDVKRFFVWIDYIQKVYEINFWHMLEKGSPDIYDKRSKRNVNFYKAYLMIKTLLIYRLNLVDVLKIKMQVYLLEMKIYNLMENGVYRLLDSIIEYDEIKSESLKSIYNIDGLNEYLNCMYKKRNKEDKRDFYADILKILALKKTEIYLGWMSHILKTKKNREIRLTREGEKLFREIRRRRICLKQIKIDRKLSLVLSSESSSELSLKEEVVWKDLSVILNVGNNKEGRSKLEVLKAKAFKLLSRLPYFKKQMEKGKLNIIVFVIAMQLFCYSEAFEVDALNTYRGREKKETRRISKFIENRAKIDDFDRCVIYYFIERQYYSNCGFLKVFDDAMKCKEYIYELLRRCIYENDVEKINCIYQWLSYNYTKTIDEIECKNGNI